jgi:hypothetical protein
LRVQLCTDIGLTPIEDFVGALAGGQKSLHRGSANFRAVAAGVARSPRRGDRLPVSEPQTLKRLIPD